jgi:hypothetical protein
MEESALPETELERRVPTADRAKGVVAFDWWHWINNQAHALLILLSWRKVHCCPLFRRSTNPEC